MISIRLTDMRASELSTKTELLSISGVETRQSNQSFDPSLDCLYRGATITDFEVNSSEHKIHEVIIQTGKEVKPKL